MQEDETTRSGGGAWVRLALIPPAVLLLILGVWLLPSLTSMGGLGAALLGVVWVVALVATLRQLSVPMPEADRATIEAELFVRPEERQDWLARFVTLLTLSTIIAALGLLADSTAVVIGAMVVAPLMAPIMSLAGALTMTRPVRIAESAAIVTGGTAVSVATAIIVSWVVPGTLATSEILARTQPQLTDLGIALAAGAAGAYVTVRPHALGALPGVAIAVALVPPLATVGIMLETGRHDAAGQAFILFVTNLSAIALSAAIVFVVTGFTASAAEIRRARRLRIGLAIAVAATIAVMIPLAQNSIARHTDQEAAAAVRRALEPILTASASSIESVTVERGARPVRVVVELAGSSPPAAQELAPTVAEALDERVSLELLWRFGDSADAGS
jgi:uncharacterized hydrophobic protein (TIGR00271 family)